MRRPLPLALASLLIAAHASPQRQERRRPEPDAAAAPIVRDEASTRWLVAYYQQSKHWALSAITMLALGSKWHPEGSEMLVAAFRSRDPRLHAYAAQALLRTNPGDLPACATPELVDELIRKQLRNRNKAYRAKIERILETALPGVGPAGEKRTPVGWSVWWSHARKTYAPPAWVPPPAKQQPSSGGRTVVSSVVKRAFDLNHAGLDVAITIDSTGSMQRTIDTARAALTEIVAMLQGISPKLRVGLVHYRDFGDLGEGAKILVPLTKNVRKVERRLEKLRAGGGGDIPERVEKGLELAISADMGWKRDSNKVVIVIGDAPPHPDAVETATAIAGQAYTHPMLVRHGHRRPTTPSGRKHAVRPFVTSTIAVGGRPLPEFQAIAKAGGGAAVRIGRLGNDDRAVQAVVRHILLLSFGTQWKREMGVFVDTFFEYRRIGFLD